LKLPEMGMGEGHILGILRLFLRSAFAQDWAAGRGEPQTVPVREICLVSASGFVKMYYFAIDFSTEMPYPLAPPQGWEAVEDL
jgi:hypothetical protein